MVPDYQTVNVGKKEDWPRQVPLPLCLEKQSVVSFATLNCLNIVKIPFQFQPKVYHSGSDSVPIHTKPFLLWEKLSVELDSNYDIFKPLVDYLTY